MADSTTILLYGVVIVLTVLLVFIGVKIYQILDQILKSISRLNGMLDGMSSFSSNLGQQVKSLSGFSEGLKAAFGLVKMLRKKNGN